MNSERKAKINKMRKGRTRKKKAKTKKKER